VPKEYLPDALQPEVRANFLAAIQKIQDLGATIDFDLSLPSTEEALAVYYVIAPSEASANLARYDGVRYGLRVPAATTADMNAASRTAGFGAEVKRRIMLGTYALSAGYYDAYYGKAQKVRTLILRDFDRAYEQFDVLIGPTAPSTAFAFGAKADPLAMYLNDVFTIPSNLAGHPALSLPFGTGDDGLPVGVQVLAPALGEVAMFRAAAALEASR
jgi:aspartyl-tRNA(Asn)/glutamyl-tRNA(Gln) amidotransferase subunit A